MPVEVPQVIDLKKIVEQVKQLGSTQNALGELADVPPPQLSLCISGARCLSTGAQAEILQVLDFLKCLRQSTDLPLDLTNTTELLPHYERWKSLRRRDAVVRTAAEISVVETVLK